MSIESLIAENTEALKANTAAFQLALKHLAGPQQTEAPAPAKAEKPKKAEKPAAPTGATAKAVADAIMGIATNVSRDAAVAIIRKFGVEHISEIKPADYAAVLEAVKAAQTIPVPAAMDSLV
jgi:hypothetical protein